MSEEKKTLKQNVKELFEGCLTIPNLISVIRICLIPVIAVLYYNNYIWWTVFVIFISGLSDAVDGKIARKFDAVTNFGKFLDPIADKLLTHTAFIMLCAMDRLNVIACIIFIAREFVVSGLRLVAVEQGHVIAAGMSGKVKTVLQMVLVLLLTVMSGNILTDIVMLAAAVMTLYSMVEYVWQNRAVLGGAK